MTSGNQPDLTAALDAQVDADEEERQPDGMWHPSSMWLCPRQAIYNIREAEVTNPPDKVSRRRFRIGHLLHEYAQGALLRLPGVAWVLPEFPVVLPGLAVDGHGDALVGMESGDVWLVEIKTTKAAALKKGLNEHHLNQAKTYAVAARLYGVPAYEGHAEMDALGERLKGIIVIYLEKGDLLTAEYVTEYDPAWEKEVFDRVEYLEQYRHDAGSLPPCYTQEAKGNEWLRRYCPYGPEGCKAEAVEPRLDDEW